MIPNMWYALIESTEVKPGKPLGVRRLGMELVFWRKPDGQIVVMRDLCPHRQAKLSGGKIVEGNIQCPYHGFQYDAAGACQLVPANGRNGPKPRMFQCLTFPAREAHGFVWVWYGEPRAEYPPLAYFDDLEGVPYATKAIHWNVDHTRAIESVLDVSHLPFVHANTIGRGGRTLVNGPYTTLANDKIRVWVSNQPDAGLPAIKPSQVPESNEPPMLWFNFPNVWRIRLAPQVSQALVFAPIDDENTVLYLRSYQGFVRAPLLGGLLAWIANQFNAQVLQEDARVVMTQTPKKSGLDVGDRYIPSDRPIALYLAHRRDLILAAQNPGLTPVTATSRAALRPGERMPTTGDRR
jgi:phenylpropionate dioxygenase-like ring-hydroxylating dioxygenase large terminal subunit